MRSNNLFCRHCATPQSNMQRRIVDEGVLHFAMRGYRRCRRVVGGHKQIQFDFLALVQTPASPYHIYLKLLRILPGEVISCFLHKKWRHSSMSSSTQSSTHCEANQGVVGLAFTWILLTIGIIAVSLRLYVRLGIRHNIGWDDYTAVASLVSTTIQ